MDSKPILFNSEMVRAILDGRKCQTRRPLKVAKGEYWSDVPEMAKKYLPKFGKSPFGQAGDSLWVREKTRVINTSANSIPGYAIGGCDTVKLQYEADGGLSKWITYPERLKPLARGYCVPNGCFKEASRITLKVKRVWVERVQEITEGDALEEGIIRESFYPDDGFPLSYGYTHEFEKVRLDKMRCLDTHASKSFASLWNSIYKNWDENPWVWACEFERIEK